MNISSTNKLLIDDQSVLQNRWSAMKFWPIPNITEGAFSHATVSEDYSSKLFNPFMPNGFYLDSFNQSISSMRVVWLVFLIPCFIEIPVFNASSADPDQMPSSVASDLGLNCLSMSLLWDARHKWVYRRNFSSDSWCLKMSKKTQIRLCEFSNR